MNNDGLPFSEAGERGILCSLLLSPGAVMPLCAKRLPLEAFYIPSNRILFETITQWTHPERAVDFIWLEETLKAAGDFEEVGGKENLSALFNFVPSWVNAEFYINLAVEAYQRRRMVRLGDEMILRAKDTQQDVQQLVSESNRQIEEITHFTNGNGAKSPKFKPGHSLAWYAKQAIDPEQTLLGNRYLCRTGGMFIVAPSGMGKSTLSLQMAVLWCCGLVAFGIKPSKALRILIVQSEDDQGDCTEMTQVINHLKLSDERKLLVEGNTKLIRCNDLVGHRFIEALEAELAQARDEGKPFDLVIVNPYGVFLGADAKDVDACTQFLNTWLNPLLSKFAVGVILIHHTPKTNFRDTTDWKPSDWMYSGAGAAVITNWARAYLAIDPCGSNDVYKFIAAKRGRRIGWGNRVPVYETFWAHSREDNQLLWLAADQDQIAAAKTASKQTPDDVLALIPLVDPISQELLLLHAHEKLNGIGINKVKDFVKILIDEAKIVEKKLPRPGAKSAKGYIRAN